MSRTNPPTPLQSLLPPPPPLLLTKRVTSFLRQNLFPQTSIATSMLTTPAGNLLAHASSTDPNSPQPPLPASALRRQCAVAASISRSSPRNTNPNKPITVQMGDGSIFIIRRLKSGMLFVGIGGRPISPPSPQSKPDSSPPTTTDAAQDGTAQAQNTEDLATPTPQAESATQALAVPRSQGEERPSDGQESITSHQGSVNSTITATSAATATSTTTVSPPAVIAMRRQVEELARWLDDKLGALCVPEEGIGLPPPSSGVGSGVVSPGYQSIEAR
ncbi:hypothetical protein QBC35DRAFT_493407 [Podospora australis]|uniref:Uncharacterized protein n=1 Tax=Podospora australis TaxID=1536484 RepID=A0AAN6WW87_9PEZI|nr:hypothetical protein QBC35DRAFT_493407 [Podospora australis]